jgi:hypothetical protein
MGAISTRAGLYRGHGPLPQPFGHAPVGAPHGRDFHTGWSFAGMARTYSRSAMHL